MFQYTLLKAGKNFGTFVHLIDINAFHQFNKSDVGSLTRCGIVSYFRLKYT